MSNGKSGRKKKLAQKIGRVLIMVIILVLWYVYETKFSDTAVSTEQTQTNTIEQEEEIYTQSDVGISNVEGELILTMIDVGQADCFLLEQNGKTALVDCGTRSTGKDAVEYLKSLGITKLDYVFGTHPHDDHMGGMYDVITNFKIGKIIIPEVEAGEVTANWYITLMEEIQTNNYIVEDPEKGDIYSLGGAVIKVIEQMTDAGSNINNYSIVLKVSFGEMDIIMTGDAELEVEELILNSGENIDAEIFKVGHHGSDTSNSEEFLDAISPEYALISTKLGNKYDHPIKSTMEKLEERNIEVYRTDENGIVIATITPKGVTFSCEPGDYLSGIELEEKEGTK